jgi:hypothetical protein
MPARYDERFPYRTELDLPVIGIEAEFKVYLDEVEVTPEEVWKTPSGFIDRPLLKRTNKSSQLPTGGAVYFDGGVLEVVTPVIEIAPQCTARVVRSLWEQIGFVRDELTKWEQRSGKRVRLEAFSCHFNVSYELPREERNRNRTIQKLALLLAHLLPVPVIVTGANRRSTGIGVRPRRDRIEITLDFTPDPGLAAATAALIVGIVREVIGWESYHLSRLDALQLPLPAGVEPGKHVTRKGWLTKDFHYPRSPFTTDPDAAVWLARDGRTLSLREIALEIATRFRDSIRRLSDPFSFRLLFSLLRGETLSLVDLPDRPSAYEDVGRLVRWGTVIPELENFASLMDDAAPPDALQEHLHTREEERRRYAGGGTDEWKQPGARRRRRADLEEKLAPPWSGEKDDRRHFESQPGTSERRRGERRLASAPFPSSRRLTRSAYEKVFLKLGSGGCLKIDDELLTPVAVRGWYHSIFRDERGEERMLSIDQLLAFHGSWVEGRS